MLFRPNDRVGPLTWIILAKKGVNFFTRVVATRYRGPFLEIVTRKTRGTIDVRRIRKVTSFLTSREIGSYVSFARTINKQVGSTDPLAQRGKSYRRNLLLEIRRMSGRRGHPRSGNSSK